MSDFNQPIGGNDRARFSGPNTFMRLLQALEGQAQLGSGVDHPARHCRGQHQGR